MPRPEQPSEHQPPHDTPLAPNVLPPELTDFLRNEAIACVLQATDRGTVLVMKLSSAEIRRVRGVVPIEFRQELYVHPAAPVIRLVVTIYDDPAQPLAFESFVNVNDAAQRADFATLTTQDEL